MCDSKMLITTVSGTLLYALFEAWLGKTKKTKASSLVELIVLIIVTIVRHKKEKKNE